jgi:hypothetical protein
MVRCPAISDSTFQTATTAPTPSLRAKRSNPELAVPKVWIASSLALLAMAMYPDLTEGEYCPYLGKTGR